MTSGGQTPYPISTIFYRLLEGTIGDVYIKDEVPAPKIVDGRVMTDRHTDRHIDRHDQLHDSCPSLMGNYNKKNKQVRRPHIVAQESLYLFRLHLWITLL